MLSFPVNILADIRDIRLYTTEYDLNGIYSIESDVRELPLYSINADL